MTRGVSEVISTIMLNFIATGLVAYLLTPAGCAETARGPTTSRTKPIPRVGPGAGAVALIPGARQPGDVYGFIVVAVVVGVGYWFLLNRTRFGFDLRATGQRPSPPRSPAASTSRG